MCFKLIKVKILVNFQATSELLNMSSSNVKSIDVKLSTYTVDSQQSTY